MTLSVATEASADDVLRLHFAGFALAGNASQNEEYFPLTTRLIADPRSKINLNKIILDGLNRETYKNIKIESGLGNLKNGDTLSLAFVLTWENVSKEKYNDFTKIAINLQAQAIVFDYKTKRIIANFPFGAEYIDSTNGDVTNQKILSDLSELYNFSSESIVNQFIKVVGKIKPKSEFGGRIQIASANILPSAALTLQGQGISNEKAVRILTNSFEQYLSANGDIPVLPHAKDQVIGGVMPARFVNGESYNFIIPPSDYNIHITLTGIKKIIILSNDSQNVYAYASYVDVDVIQSLSGREYIKESIKYPVVKIIAKSGTPDDSSSFQESLISISDQITRQWKEPSKDWNKKWLVSEGSINQSLDMPALLDKCR